jgi:hypothetical protein
MSNGEKRVQERRYKCMWVLEFPLMPKGEIVGKYLTDSEWHKYRKGLKYRKSKWHKYRKNVQRIVGKYLTDNECLSLMASTMVKMA